MLAIVTLTYLVPLEALAAHTPAHRAYLGELHAKGTLIASGPFAPRTGGALLLRVEREEELAAIVAGDPFHMHGVAAHDVRVWSPTFGGEALEALSRARAI
jgi:uncharacterized protein YciI